MEVQGTNYNATGAQTENYESSNNKLFEIVNSNFNEKRNSDVRIRNISGRHIDRAEIKMDDVYYFVYDIENGEEYVINSFSENEINEIEVISVEFDIKSLYSSEISLNKVEIKDEILKGSFKNNGERNLYPSEIIYFVKDENGNNVQKLILYAGCFDDSLVIKTGEIFEFNQEEKSELSSEKNIIIRYSDTSFRETVTLMFNQEN